MPPFTQMSGLKKGNQLYLPSGRGWGKAENGPPRLCPSRVQAARYSRGDPEHGKNDRRWGGGRVAVPHCPHPYPGHRQPWGLQSHWKPFCSTAPLGHSWREDAGWGLLQPLEPTHWRGRLPPNLRVHQSWLPLCFLHEHTEGPVS